MVRGEYTVQDMDESKPPRRDASFKSCVISMFIIFLICIIIILIVWRVDPGSDDRPLRDGESLGKTDYRSDKNKKQPPLIYQTTELPETPHMQSTFVTTEPPPITTKEVEKTTVQQFAKIKFQPQTTASVLTTQKTEITESSTTSTQPTYRMTSPLYFTTNHTTVKHDQIIISEDSTTSFPRTTNRPFTSTKEEQVSQEVNISVISTSGTTDSISNITTVKQGKTTTVVIPPHILVAVTETQNTTSSLQSTTSFPPTENDSATVTPEGTSDKTSIVTIINDTETTAVYGLVSDPSKATSNIIVKSTSSIPDEGNEETTETKITINDPIPSSTTDSQDVSSNLTTTIPPATTTETAHIPLVIPHPTRSHSTTSDTSTSVTEAVIHTTNSSYATTELDKETVTGFAKLQVYNDSDTPVTSESDEETTTDPLKSQYFVTVTESQNSTPTQPLTVVDSSSTAVTDSIVKTIIATSTESLGVVNSSSVTVTDDSVKTTIATSTLLLVIANSSSSAVTDNNAKTIIATSTESLGVVNSSSVTVTDDSVKTTIATSTLLLVIANSSSSAVTDNNAKTIIATSTESLGVVNSSSTAATDDNLKTTTVTPTQPLAVINSSSVAVTDDSEENTTYSPSSHITQSTVWQPHIINSTSAGTTVQETTTDAIGVTKSLNTTLISDSTTASDIDSTTPVTIHKDDETCETSECKALTSRILSLMNHSVDPCDNFYEYACGGLRDNHGLLQEDLELDVWNRIASAVREVNSQSNSIYQKFRYFYDQCVDYENTVNQSVRLELARQLVNEVDKMYNKIEWAQTNDHFSLTSFLVKLFHANSAPLFDVSVDVNPHDPAKFQLKLTLPRTKSKLQLESLSAARCKSHIYSDDPKNIDMRTVYESNYRPCISDISEYVTTLEKAVKEMELYDNTTSAYNISQDISAIKFFIEFDILSLLDEIIPWEVRTNTLEKKFELVTVGDLDDKYPEVNWEVLFEALLDDPVNRNTEVQLYFEDYFSKLFEKLNSSLSNVTARYIIHNGLLAMLAHDTYVDLVQPRPCNREEYCLRIASGLMEDVSSSLYLSTFTSEELRSKEHELVTLFEQLKNVLNEEIMHAVWLDEDARSSMTDKLHKMKVMADGGRAILSDPNYLRNQLNDRDMSVSNNYFENAIQLQRRFRKQLYYLVTYEANSTLPEVIWTFFLLPYDIQPIPVYQLNAVVIPYGMIGSWKPTDEIPSFVWKARVGNKIARQIAHHFDHTGILYSPGGKDNNFLQYTTIDSYSENYEGCEIASAAYSRTWTNQKNQIYHYQMDPDRTVNENFAYNSALWFTHKLYNKTAMTEPLLPWLEKNHDELYFLLAVQEFCAKAELLDYTIMMFETEQLPPYLRAENMILNSPVFGRIYSCPIGSNQNPNFRCFPFPNVDEELNDFKPIEAA